MATLHAEPQGGGAGIALLETAFQVAVASGHSRLWLVTTNDNLPAIHFYLRRGMHVATVHAGAVDRDRAMKPQIPMVNAENGIPVRDLVEFELRADAARGGSKLKLPPIAFPRVDDLDKLPLASFVHELTPLFEGAPAFLGRLADERPFGSDGALIKAAFEVSRRISQAEALELIEAHPRIGAPPDAVSGLSYAEQGYATEAADAETARAYKELAVLNEIYERRFGFRYVIFVAGRPKTVIVPLLEAALRNERDAELRRAVADTVYIAADRLATLRG